MENPRSILITGASSGLGEALALVYAAPGVTLALSGRDRGRLDRVAQACRAAGAAVSAEILDVTGAEEVARWIEEMHAKAPLDLVIANAGISGGTGGGVGATGESDEQVRRIFAVNLDGVVNTVLPAAALMRAREPRDGVKGQIAIMSSLASFRGIPGVPTYCASKAAVRIYGEALRGALAGDGIEVSVICPGYVKTPMTAGNPYRMPFLMERRRAARIMKRGLAKGRARIAFPLRLYALVWLMAALPPALTDPLMRLGPKKPASE